jgi:hypothetical protein
VKHDYQHFMTVTNFRKEKRKLFDTLFFLYFTAVVCLGSGLDLFIYALYHASIVRIIHPPRGPSHNEAAVEERTFSQQ